MLWSDRSGSNSIPSPAPLSGGCNGKLLNIKFSVSMLLWYLENTRKKQNNFILSALSSSSVKEKVEDYVCICVRKVQYIGPKEVTYLCFIITCFFHCVTVCLKC